MLLLRSVPVRDSLRSNGLLLQQPSGVWKLLSSHFCIELCVFGLGFSALNNHSVRVGSSVGRAASPPRLAEVTQLQ